MKESLTADTTISHYRIVSKIGAGGMGEVYLAEDIRLGRKVALELLPAGLAADDEAKRRARARAGAELAAGADFARRTPTVIFTRAHHRRHLDNEAQSLKACS